LKDSWWPPGRDLQTFRLAKFFTLTSFVVILVFTVVLTLILSHRAQKMSLAKSEEYLKLLAANLNHQVFQQFLVPTAIEKQGLEAEPIFDGRFPLTGELKKDPSCGTYISAATSIKETVGGQTVHFCSKECRDKHVASLAR
jgi:YHS domain-containing protein